MIAEHRAPGRGRLPLWLVLGLVTLLSGCAGASLGSVIGSAISGAAAAPALTSTPEGNSEISTTELPPPPEEGAASEAALPEADAVDPAPMPAPADPNAATVSAPNPILPETARRAPPRRPDARTAAPQDTLAAPAVQPATPALPVPSTVFGQRIQQQAQEECARAGGQLARRGGTDALTCLIRPRDAGKSCTRKSDCEGQCLARSGTCSPVIPLLGCYEVLLDSGARVTECRQ